MADISSAASTQEFETIMKQLGEIRRKLDDSPNRDEMNAAIGQAVKQESDERKRALTEAMRIERDARKSDIDEMRKAFDLMLNNVQTLMKGGIDQFNAAAVRIEQGFSKLTDDVREQGQAQAKDSQRLNDLIQRTAEMDASGSALALSYHSMKDRIFGSEERPDDESIIQTLRALPSIINKQAEERLRGVNGRLDGIQRDLDPIQAWYKNHRTWEMRLWGLVERAAQSPLVWIALGTGLVAFISKLVSLLGG